MGTGQVRPGAMDRTCGQPEVKLSFFRCSNSLKRKAACTYLGPSIYPAQKKEIGRDHNKGQSSENAYKLIIKKFCMCTAGEGGGQGGDGSLTYVCDSGAGILYVHDRLKSGLHKPATPNTDNLKATCHKSL